MIMTILESVIKILAVFGAIFQWKETNQNNRSKYLGKLLEKLWEDKDIVKFISLCDYDKDWYNESFHRSQDRTIPDIADKSLFFFSYLCYELDSKVIHRKERKLFDYYLASLAYCSDMERYLFDLYQYSLHNRKPFPFEYFLDFCIKNKMLPEEIKDSNYFLYVLKEESAENEGKSIDVPLKMDRLREKLGDELYLQTCSRCRHCKNYLAGKCSKNQDMSKVEWIPADQKNKCSSFIFDESSWSVK